MKQSESTFDMERHKKINFQCFCKTARGRANEDTRQSNRSHLINKTRDHPIFPPKKETKCRRIGGSYSEPNISTDGTGLF
jgi:hypothetical protein